MGNCCGRCVRDDAGWNRMLALTHPVQGLRDGEWGITDEPGLVRSPLQKASPAAGRRRCATRVQTISRGGK